MTNAIICDFCKQVFSESLRHYHIQDSREEYREEACYECFHKIPRVKEK